ncbi:MAG: glycosyltransferase [Fimbriimonadaceae bacterium]|nr:glycosyltransferase [Fimbriimonadaceae bacterium]
MATPLPSAHPAPIPIAKHIPAEELDPLPVSVVIVSYNTRDKLRQCLYHLQEDQQSTGVGYEIIVVDNNSNDGSAGVVSEDFPEVRLIRNATNVGFGTANNIGIRAATRDLVLLLNSDAYVDSGAIQRLVEVFDPLHTQEKAGGLSSSMTKQHSAHSQAEVTEDSDPPRDAIPTVEVFDPLHTQEKAGGSSSSMTGQHSAHSQAEVTVDSDPPPNDPSPGANPVVAAGARLLNPDRTLQESSCNELTLWAVFCEQSYLEKLFPNSRLFSPYWNSRKHNGTAEVEQVMGACMMMRKGFEFFDERFFLYCEDTELCKRLRKQGKILYVPSAQVTHDLGSSSDASRWRAVAFYNRGKELYFEIHHGKTAAFMCWWLNRWGAFLRGLVWTLIAVLSLNKNPEWIERAKLFWKVLAAPKLGPPDPRSSRTPPHTEG